MNQTRRYYKIAGVIFELRFPFDYLEMEQYQLYAIPETEPDIILSFTEERVEIPIGEEALTVGYNRITQTEKEFYVELLGGDMQTAYGCLVLPREEAHFFQGYLYPGAQKYLPHATQVFKAISIDHLLNRQNRYILHASYIKWNDVAILFSAPSGTGKSTQAELWEKYARAEIINGDRAIIGQSGNQWTAYGSPYAGSSGIFKNVSTKLGAIVVLRQNTENHLEKISGKEALRYLYEECIVHTWDRLYIEILMDLLVRTVEQIPVFRLECRPDEESVEMLRKELEKRYGVD